MEGIQLSVKQTGANNDISVIKVGGYIDTTTSAELEHSLELLLQENNYNIIIDLANVDYISSAGWGIFISELKGIRDQGGDLKLVNMMPDVYEVFELLEFHYILKAFDSIEEAIIDFDKRKVVDHDVSFHEERASDEHEKITSDYSGYESNEQTEQSEAAIKINTSIEDKIRKMVIQTPEMSSIKILKRLKSPRYGREKINYFQLLRYLKKLNLNSKKKRIEYVQHMNG